VGVSAAWKRIFQTGFVKTATMSVALAARAPTCVPQMIPAQQSTISTIMAAEQIARWMRVLNVLICVLAAAALRLCNAILLMALASAAHHWPIAPVANAV